jgi:hypothetical protein
MKVWCSKPGTAIVSSWTTFIKIISAPQAIQRIARLTDKGYRTDDAIVAAVKV